MIFKYDYKVGLNSINNNYEITNKSILEYLENIADMHSTSVNNNIEDFNNSNYTWVLIEWNLKVIKRPKYGDEIEINTWCKNLDDRFAYRDFEIFLNGEKCIVASSKWLIVNFETKKISKITCDFINQYLPENKEAIENKKLKKLNIQETYDLSTKVSIRKSDIDINGHLHNLNYIDLIRELMDFSEEYNEFRIVYKKEIKYGDNIIVSKRLIDDKFCFVLKSEDGIIHAIAEYSNNAL